VGTTAPAAVTDLPDISEWDGTMPDTTPNTIHAPWTAEQVEALNDFQERGGMHPFTCGSDHHEHRNPNLRATIDGWVCRDTNCDYTQDWALAFMADPDAWPKPFRDRASVGGHPSTSATVHHLPALPAALTTPAPAGPAETIARLRERIEAHHAEEFRLARQISDLQCELANERAKQPPACGCAEAPEADRELDRRIAAITTVPQICGDRNDAWPETICTDPPRHRMPHGGQLIIDGQYRGGASWGDVDGYADPPTHITIPRDAFDQLVTVARHVSLGRGAADLTPYPDAAARRALGALDDAGLLDDSAPDQATSEEDQP
jgi:hypothetical protein